MYVSQSSSRRKNYRMQMAIWAGDNTELDPHFSGIRQVRVLHYHQHLFDVDRTHTVAIVELPQNTIFDLGYCHTVKVWQNRLQNDGPAT